MKQLPNQQRRPRGRGNNRPRHPGGNRNQHFDSNGPEGRIRGTANQIFDRYIALARDAQSSGDTVMAENYFQHAEHYYRIFSLAGGFNAQQNNRPRNGEDGDEQPELQDGSMAQGDEDIAGEGDQPNY